MSQRKLTKTLFVDDEPAALRGYRLTLRGKFDVVTAGGGEEGLQAMAEHPDIAVIVSDLNMPGMDGIQFLTRARDLRPEPVRLLLTGNANLQAAIEAINSGAIFRFLTKPCGPELLEGSVRASISQYNLIRAEKDVLERTLRGSIQALANILSLVSPPAFGMANRAKELCSEIAAELGAREPWKVEVSALLSQVGALVLPAGLTSRLYGTGDLDPEEAAAAAKIPSTSARLVQDIPRLDDVRAIIEQQDQPAVPPPGASPPPLEARILKAALDFDRLLTKGAAEDGALASLQRQDEVYDVDVVLALGRVVSRRGGGGDVVEMGLGSLRPGMVVAEDVKSKDGVLLIARGYEILPATVERIQRLLRDRGRLRVHRFGCADRGTEGDGPVPGGDHSPAPPVAEPATTPA